MDEKKVPAELVLHNATRSRFNRLQRQSDSQHHERQLHIGAGEMRVLKGRPKTVSSAWLSAHLPEIREKVQAGLLEVKTVDGLPFDLFTGDIAPVPVVVPLPNPPMDSVARDTKVGEKVYQMLGGVALADLTATGGSSLEGIPGPKTPQDKLDEEAAFEAASALGGDLTDKDVVFERPAGKGKARR